MPTCHRGSVAALPRSMCADSHAKGPVASGGIATTEYFLGYRPIFLLRPAHDLEHIIRQRPLQRLGLTPRRAYPDIAVLIGRQDHRHRVGWIGSTTAFLRLSSGNHRRGADRGIGLDFVLRAPATCVCILIPTLAIKERLFVAFRTDRLNPLGSNSTIGSNSSVGRRNGTFPVN